MVWFVGNINNAFMRDRLMLMDYQILNHTIMNQPDLDESGSIYD